MEEYYKNNSEDSDFANKVPAHLSIYVNPETLELVFSCDWIDSEENLYYLAEIFFQLKHKDLVDKMIENLHTQCVLDDRTEDYNKIKNEIDRKARLLKNKNDIVVSPRDIPRL